MASQVSELAITLTEFLVFLCVLPIGENTAFVVSPLIISTTILYNGMLPAIK